MTSIKRLAGGIFAAVGLMLTMVVSPAGATQGNAGSTEAATSAAAEVAAVRYRAEETCYEGNRRFSASMTTWSKPTPSNRYYTEAQTWGYNIMRTTGNHNNTKVAARLYKYGWGALGWYWYPISGIAYRDNMPEDAKWHQGPMDGSRPLVGWNDRDEQVALHVTVEFDGNPNTGCAVLLNVGKLQLI